MYAGDDKCRSSKTRSGLFPCRAITSSPPPGNKSFLPKPSSQLTRVVLDLSTRTCKDDNHCDEIYSPGKTATGERDRKTSVRRETGVWDGEKTTKAEVIRLPYDGYPSIMLFISHKVVRTDRPVTYHKRFAEAGAIHGKDENSRQKSVKTKNEKL